MSTTSTAPAPPPPPPRPRYIPNTPSLNLTRCPDPHRQLLQCLTNIVTHYPPTTTDRDPDDPPRGLFRGPTSVAYLFLRLADLYNDSLIIESKTCLEWSNLYAYTTPSPSPTATAKEPAGILDEPFTNATIRSILTHDITAAEHLCDLALARPPSTINAEAKATATHSNEWFNGRAGTLYLLRVLKHYFRADATLGVLIDSTVHELVSTMYACPRPWKWHNTPWVGVGAVHGNMGMLVQVVLSAPTVAAGIGEDVERVLNLQREDGGWGMRVPDGGEEARVQFCHGAVGVVAGLVAVRELIPDPEMRERIDGAVVRGRDHIWERGVLTKEPCLCHGVSGNALALDWERFEKFMALATVEKVEEGVRDGTYSRSDHPYSLYCGEAGRAWCWAVADKGPEMSGRFIGWNDL